MASPNVEFNWPRYLDSMAELWYSGNCIYPVSPFVSEARMSDVKPATIKMHCPGCSKKLGFPLQAAGKKARCPACAQVFKIAAPTGDLAAPAAPAARITPPPPPPPPPQEEFSLFALAASEGSADELELSPEEAARAQALTASTSAAHQAAMVGMPADPTKPERTGRTSQRASTGRETGAGIDRSPSAVGMLAKGLVCSAGGALIGSFIWFGVAKALDLELGYVAWAVGLLAGGGMQLGVRAQTNLAGVIAAAFSIAGIFVGKVMVVAWVLFPMVNKMVEQAQTKAETGINYQVDTLTEIETTKILKERKIDPETATEEQETTAVVEARDRVKGWGADKIRKEFDKYKASSAYQKTSLSDMPTVQLSIMAMVFSLGPYDFLFVILSTVSAFVIGSGRTFGK
jgi:hypothetical protein